MCGNTDMKRECFFFTKEIKPFVYFLTIIHILSATIKHQDITVHKRHKRHKRQELTAKPKYFSLENIRGWSQLAENITME